MIRPTVRSGCSMKRLKVTLLRLGPLPKAACIWFWAIEPSQCMQRPIYLLQMGLEMRACGSLFLQSETNDVMHRAQTIGSITFTKVTLHKILKSVNCLLLHYTCLFFSCSFFLFSLARRRARNNRILRATNTIQGTRLTNTI